MLEVIASVWLGSLVVTGSLLVGVLAVQGVLRRLRSATSAGRRSAAAEVGAHAVPLEDGTPSRRAA